MPGVEEDEGDEGPEAKRARNDSLSTVTDPKAKHLRVSWADLKDEEDKERGVAADSPRCDHCDRTFPSRNRLFEHLRTVGREAAVVAESEEIQKTQMLTPQHFERVKQ